MLNGVRADQAVIIRCNISPDKLSPGATLVRVF